jgi:hypothetical protein
VYPLDVVKSRLQAVGAGGRYSGAREIGCVPGQWHAARGAWLAWCPAPRVRGPPKLPRPLPCAGRQNETKRCAAGWVDCAVQSHRQEGAGVFVRGLSTTLGRAFVVNGAIFGVYELCHTMLGGGRAQQRA